MAIPMKPRSLDHLLTIEQLSSLLQVRRSTVYAWVHQGFIPHVKLGRLVRFDRDDVIRWLEERKQAGRPHRKLALD